MDDDARVAGQVRPIVARSWQLLIRIAGAGHRLTRWSLATVEDDPPPDRVPTPGPAHSPIPAIELRLEARRRRVS